MLAAVPYWKQQIQRDREEELIHRGTMYMRAIQHYYVRLGRYPTRIEDLENTNNVRYLRKRYKDPMSWDPQTKKEKDFKILHMQDVMGAGGPTIGQGAGGIPTMGGVPGVPGMPGQGAIPGQGGMPNSSAFANTFGQMNPSGMQPQANPLGSDNTDSSTSGSSDSSSSTTGSNTTGSNGSSPSGSGPSAGGPTSGGQPLTGQVFGGGGPMLGVGSTNKKLKTIREFNKKSKYTDWYFVYDASADKRGLLLVGPWQPLTITSGGVGQPIGTGPGGTQPVTGQSPTQTPTQSPQGLPGSPSGQTPPTNPPNN